MLDRRTECGIDVKDIRLKYLWLSNVMSIRHAITLIITIVRSNQSGSVI